MSCGARREDRLYLRRAQSRDKSKLLANRFDAANYQASPNVSYTYDDTNIANAKGKLTKVASSVSTTEYTEFDILGRVKAHKQTTDGQSYTTGYTYNLAGALIEQKYPSGRVVKNVLDANGDLSMVQSKKNAAAGYWNYAENLTFNPAGAVTSMQLGNGKWASDVMTKIRS
jgi:YD repeat-containing protein